MIAVFSDLHGNSRALEETSPLWRGAEGIICLGDTVGYRRHPEEAVAATRAVADVVLQGNHDAAATGNLDDFLEMIPPWLRVTLQDVAELPDDLWEWLYALRPQGEWGDIELVHGSLRDPLMEFLVPEVAEAHFAIQQEHISLCGHTHQPLALGEESGAWEPSPERNRLDISEGRWALNPGSLGASRGGVWMEIAGDEAVWHWI